MEIAYLDCVPTTSLERPSVAHAVRIRLEERWRDIFQAGPHDRTNARHSFSGHSAASIEDSVEID